MLSISKPIRGSGQGEYYLNLASTDDYYLDGEEPPGFWLGAGAKALGLEGVLEEEEFRHLLRGLGPNGQQALVHNARSPKRRAGWDLTWSVPKSVSTLWSQAPPDVRAAVERAVRLAVGEGVRYLESVGVVTRRGEDGIIRENARLVFAAFPHSTSRALDPQLHIHTILLNVAVRPDLTTGAIDPREMFRHQHTADAIFRVELASVLEQRLGLRAVRVGRALELLGVDRGLMDEFSKRRKEIENVLEQRGLSGAKAAEVVAFETRTKKVAIDRDSLFSMWRRMGQEHRWSTEEVNLLLRAPFPTRNLDTERAETSRDALKTITFHESHFPLRTLTRALAELAQGRGLSAGDIYNLRDSMLRGREIVPLGPKDREMQFSTPGMLAIEHQFVSLAKSLNDSGTAIPQAAKPFHDAIGRHPELTPEQRAMVRAAVGTEGGLQLVSGMAGTGKSFAFRVAKEIWESQGLVVHGVALAGKAAAGLQESTGIPCQTLHRLLWGIQHGAIQLDRRSVVLVDEAAMVGTRQLRDLIAACVNGHARLVLAGDPGQLQSVEAGGGFAALIREYGAVHLQGIQRQREPWACKAVMDFATGRADEAFAAYLERGFVHVSPTSDAAEKQLVEHWSKAPRPDQNLVLAGTNSEISRLNTLAQSTRAAPGGPCPIRIGGQEFFVGDRVLFARNSQALGVFNGELGTIKSRDGGQVLVSMDQGRTITFDPTQYTHLRLGYALTTHKAQGTTTENAWVLPGGVQNRELTYVQASRARGQTRFFVSEDGVSSLMTRMARSQPKQLATDLRQGVRLEHELTPG